LDWSGWFFMFLVILWAISRVQRRIRKYLLSEVEHGIISKAQYRMACSAWAQSSLRFKGLLSGRYRDTRRFYQLCAELAHKKFQLERFGNEGQNQQIIEQIRAELAALSPRALAT
ncbi:MAG: protease PrsW, partial [Anaerolineales bacterium]|nr:protease PrsW [Anaerolineales bacterium]